MTSILLHLVLTGNSGTMQIANDINLTRFYIRTVCIKFKSTFTFDNDKRFYLRLNGLSGAIYSSIATGIPLIYTSEFSSVWCPGLEIESSSRISSRMDYIVVDQAGALIDFTHIDSIEILLDFKVL